jgi:hypothetical protein
MSSRYFPVPNQEIELFVTALLYSNQKRKKLLYSFLEVMKKTTNLGSNEINDFVFAKVFTWFKQKRVDQLATAFDAFGDLITTNRVYIQIPMSREEIFNYNDTEFSEIFFRIMAASFQVCFKYMKRGEGMLIYDGRQRGVTNRVIMMTKKKGEYQTDFNEDLISMVVIFDLFKTFHMYKDVTQQFYYSREDVEMIDAILIPTIQIELPLDEKKLDIEHVELKKVDNKEKIVEVIENDKNSIEDKVLKVREYVEDELKTSIRNDVIKCKICFDNEIQMAMSCGHLFCSSCIRRFESLTCPVCKKKSSKNEIIKLYFN